MSELVNEADIQNLLATWKGQTIRVVKEELENVDQAYLHLTDVRLKEVTRDTDDYLANRAIELVGGGETVEESGEAVLPYARYDLPLTDLHDVEANQDHLVFKNDRASYTIQPI